MRLLADMHVAPRTVAFLRSLGHDVERVGGRIPTTATDESIVASAIREERSILTQDLDFSAIVALSGRSVPSIRTRLRDLAQVRPDVALVVLRPGDRGLSERSRTVGRGPAGRSTAPS